MEDSIITLFTEDVIDSCHHLERYDGKCSNLHGHSWLLQIWIQGRDDQKDDVGILFDFGYIKKIKEAYDHKDINTLIPLNPTAENLTKLILFDLMTECVDLEFRVRLYETAVKKETWCQKQSDGFNPYYL